MKTRTLIATALAACLTGCADPTPQIIMSPNPVTGKTSMAISNNHVPHSGPFWADFQLTPMRIPADRGSDDYWINIIFYSTQWAFIEGPLTANIDGKVVTFRNAPPLDSRSVETGGAGVTESTIYFAKRSDIERLANARSVIIQVGGKGGVFFLTLSAQNFEALRQFLAKA